MNRMNRIELALSELKSALGDEDIKLERILVDKTLPLKYELTTGKPWDDATRVIYDPFSCLEICSIPIIGMDNERLRNHKEWPEDDG